MKSYTRNPWFRPRTYIHFDQKIYCQDEELVESKVKDPAFVQAHAFAPFLYCEKPKLKFKLSQRGTRVPVMGKRPICYAAHMDAHIFAYYSNLLSALYEKRLSEVGLEKTVIAFRKISTPEGKPKCNIHLANEAFNKIRSIGNCRVYAFDIKSFFDTLDPKELKHEWKALLGVSELPKDHFAIFRHLTRYKYVRRDELFHWLRIPRSPRDQRKQNLTRVCSRDFLNREIAKSSLLRSGEGGIPQGSPISATLANIYMFSFDKEIHRQITNLGGSYFRYCDDILIILPQENDFDVPRFVESELDAIKLRLNSDKTEDSTYFVHDGSVTSAGKSIQYLGFIFDGVSISVRPGSISHYRSDLKRAVSQAIAIKIRKDKQGVPNNRIRTKKIISQFSQFGERTFLAYLKRARTEMASDTIYRQFVTLSKYFDSQMVRAKRANRIFITPGSP